MKQKPHSAKQRKHSKTCLRLHPQRLNSPASLLMRPSAITQPMKLSARIWN
jgi:hypothetical protein